MAINWGDVLTNPLFQFGAAGASGIQQQRAQDEARSANEARYGQELQVRDDSLRGGLATYDAGSQQQLQTLQALQQIMPQMYGQFRQQFLGDYDQFAGGVNADYDRRAADTAAGHADRYRFAEQELEGYGDQQRADVDRYFSEQQATTQQDLLNRGLLSSTEAASQYAGVTERQSAEQRRLSEDLIRNRIDVLGGYRGEALDAQERYDFGGLGAQERLGSARSAYDIALGAAPIEAAERYGGAISDYYGNNAINRSNIFTTGQNNIANWIGARSDLPPNPNNLASIFGANAVGPPSGPSSGSSFLGGASGGFGQMGAAMLGSVLFPPAAPFLMGAGIPSDVNSKEDFKPINEGGILAKLQLMPVSRWKYKDAPGEHIGPMAQDFHSAFGVGNDTTIAVVDMFGVLLAAVKQMSKQIESLQARVV